MDKTRIQARAANFIAQARAAWHPSIDECAQTLTECALERADDSLNSGIRAPLKVQRAIYAAITAALSEHESRELVRITADRAEWEREECTRYPAPGLVYPASALGFVMQGRGHIVVKRYPAQRCGTVQYVSIVGSEVWEVIETHWHEGETVGREHSTMGAALWEMRSILHRYSQHAPTCQAT